MAKVLNLDNLATKETRELVLGGQTYRVRPMNVEDFIEAQRMADKLADATFAEQMEGSIALIKRGVPDIDVSVLKQLELEQLTAVAKFVRGEDPQDVVGSDSEGAAQGNVASPAQ